jgi:hypothetical protein
MLPKEAVPSRFSRKGPVSPRLDRTGSIAMKRVTLLGSFPAALMLTNASSAFAQSDIYRDLRDIKRDRVNIYRDRADPGEDRAAGNYDARRACVPSNTAAGVQHGTGMPAVATSSSRSMSISALCVTTPVTWPETMPT